MKYKTKLDEIFIYSNPLYYIFTTVAITWFLVEQAIVRTGAEQMLLYYMLKFNLKKARKGGLENLIERCKRRDLQYNKLVMYWNLKLIKISRYKIYNNKFIGDGVIHQLYNYKHHYYRLDLEQVKKLYKNPGD